MNQAIIDTLRAAVEASIVHSIASKVYGDDGYLIPARYERDQMGAAWCRVSMVLNQHEHGDHA